MTSLSNEPESTPQLNQPQADPLEDTATPTTTTATSVMNPSERFARGDDMRALYARMRPDQRTAVAGEFIRLLSLAGDDQAQHFREQFQRHSQVEGDAEEELLTADEVAAIDQYVRQQHPEMIEEMLNHPVTEAVLAAPGAPAEGEQDTSTDDEKVIPTENVAVTGTGYESAGVMMEEGGKPYDRMVEDPHELSAGPALELEREQRAYEDKGEEAERPSTEPPERNS